MSAGTLNWNSFWDLATPAQGARALLELYGAAAAQAAADCAGAAKTDGRHTDYRFWVAVCAELDVTGQSATGAPPVIQH
jgi:hypothetical protein